MATSEWAGRLSRRFWGAVGERILDSGALDGALARLGEYPAQEAKRLTEYAVRLAYFENKGLYRRLKSEGLRPVDMAAQWNPVPAVVEFYVANTLRGPLAVQPGRGAVDGEALAAAVEQVWEWSNFETLARELTETAAVLRDVFVKVAEKRRGPEEPTQAVYLQRIEPDLVRWWDADERNFLTGIRIDTVQNASLFTGEERRHVLAEVWRKRWGEEPGGARWYELPLNAPVEDERLGEPAQEATFEELGFDFIPVVWARAATPWWAQTDAIDEYNQLGHLMKRMNRPTAVIQGRHTDVEGRPMPAPRVAVEEVATTYQEAADGAFATIRLPGNSTFDWARSPIDMATAAAQREQIRKGVETALPEYRVAEMDATQVAANTLEMLLDQAGQRVTDLRALLERALGRAQMMALTIGQVAEVEGFEAEVIGTYEAGQLEHGFVTRGVFKPSAALMASIVKELAAAGVPIKLAMKKAGFSEEEIGEFDGAAAEQALRERTTLAAQLARERAMVDAGAGDNGLVRP